MKQISWFRGMSGEIVVDFVKPKHFAGAIPVAAAFLILQLTAGFVGRPGRWGAACVALVIYVLLAGRHALALSQGREEPVGSTDLVRFAGNYLVLSLAWIVPVLVLGSFYVRKAVQVSPELFAGPTVLYRTGFMGLAGLFLVVVLSVVPFLCLLLVARFSGLRALFDRSGWRWLLLERTDDLVAFYAALFGGFVLFLGAYLLPLKLLALLSAKLLPGKAFIVASFLYFLPIAASARFVGRLSGSFVAGEQIYDVVADGGPFFTLRVVQAPSSVITTTVLAENKGLYEPKPDVNLLMARIAGLEGEALAMARKEAEEAAAQGDTPLRSACELAFLAKKAEEAAAALDHAADAINRGAQRGFDDLCATLFQAFHRQRSSLKLAPATLEFLGYVLMSRGKYVDAAWCYHAAAIASGDPLKAQKKLIQAAQAAEKAGLSKEAYFLYDFFIANYPDSTLLDYAREAHERLKPYAAQEKD
ncbi:MAG TPA: hypothetical protein VI389_09585 [Geobacteraceae bacterium]